MSEKDDVHYTHLDQTENWARESKKLHKEYMLIKGILAKYGPAPQEVTDWLIKIYEDPDDSTKGLQNEARDSQPTEAQAQQTVPDQLAAKEAARIAREEEAARLLAAG